MSRRAFVGSMGVAGLLGVAGCLDDSDGDQPADDGGEDLSTREVQPEWITAVSAEASELSPYWAGDYDSQLRIGLVLDGTYALDENDEFYGYWFETYENHGDETYTFTLREGLEWSEGYGSMTADDWVWFYDHVIDAEENWAGYVNPADWNDVTSVRAEDERTFVVELDRPDPLFVQRPTLWGAWILPRTLTEPYYERYLDGDEQAGHDLNTAAEVLEFAYAGNLGPYRFERREIEDRFVVTRNESYYRRGQEPDAEDWENAPYFDRHVLRVLPEESTRLSEFRMGGVTETELPPDRADAFEDEAGVQIVSAPTPYIRIIAYNQRANGWEPFRERAVRQAFSTAIDKVGLVENVFNGNADVAHTYQPPYSEFYDDSLVTRYGEGDGYDPATARQSLADALSTDYEYDGDVLLGPEGAQVSLTLVYQRGTTVYEDAGQYIGDALEDLGVSVDRRGVPSNVLLDRYVSQETSNGRLVYNAGDRDEYTSEGAWDLLWSINLNTFPRSPENIDAYFTSDGAANFFGYEPSNAVRSLFERANEETDMAGKREVYADLFGELSLEQPVHFTLFEQGITGYQDDVVFTEPASHSWGYKRHSYWASSDLHGSS